MNLGHLLGCDTIEDSKKIYVTCQSMFISKIMIKEEKQSGPDKGVINPYCSEVKHKWNLTEGAQPCRQHGVI